MQMGKKENYEAKLKELRAQPDASPEEIENCVKQINKLSKPRPFHYSHQGSLAYIGSEKAIADLPFFNGNFASGGVATFLFWRWVLLWLRVRLAGVPNTNHAYHRPIGVLTSRTCSHFGTDSSC